MKLITTAFLLATATSVNAAGPNPNLLPVPSGQPIYWLETIHGLPGVDGLTYRFRFVAPELDNLVPPAPDGPMEELTDEDIAALEQLANSEEDPGISIFLQAVDSGVMRAEEIDQRPVASVEAADTAGNVEALPDPETSDPDGIEGAANSPALPRAPDSLVRDPMHDDIVWLCENFVLPRIASPAPRPSEILISLADRETKAGEIAIGAVQLFEAFTLPPDRDECVWAPF